MKVCPVPHTYRENTWLVLGMTLGVGLCKLIAFLSKTKTKPKPPVKIAKSAHVVDDQDNLIKEFVGRESTGDNRFSLVQINAKRPSSHSGTTQFEEWIVVQHGCVEIQCLDETNEKKRMINCNAGEVVYLPRGAYKYSLTTSDTKYLALCAPSFHHSRISVLD